VSLDNADTEVDFHVYYGALVELLGEKALRGALPTNRGSVRFPGDWRALLLEDEHLNNVPLRLWDAQDLFVRTLARSTHPDELKAITGSDGWSLSDTVCVLKETARRYAKEAQTA
jgi:hypothetical protein